MSPLETAGPVEAVRLEQTGPDVFQLRGDLVTIDESDIAFVKAKARESGTGRARICIHPDGSDPLHQMIIALHRSTYVRPHRHPGKSESFHVIDGRVLIVFFDDGGEPVHFIDLEAGGNRPFSHRVSVPLYHTVIPVSETCVVHEITNGPFNPADTDFAAWGPDPEDNHGIETFKNTLLSGIR